MICSTGDVEQIQDVDSTWNRARTQLLIALYKENETEFEDPRKRKKDTWKKIAQKMKEKGHNFTESQIENKWRNLLKSHKDVVDNKKKTGCKRKNFQYFEDIESIVAKRHDIHPVYVSGTEVKQKVSNYRAKSPVRVTVHEQHDPEPSGSDFSSISLDEESTSLNTSTSESKSESKSAVQRRKKRKDESETNQTVNICKETLEFLRESEAAKERREKAKNDLAQERNSILRAFIEAIKKE